MTTANNYHQINEKLNEHDLDFLDLKAVDLTGRWRHLTVPESRVTKQLFETGVGFDGSSYGYSTVQNSDLVLKPDSDTSMVERTPEGKLLSVICSIHQVDENGARRPASQSPRLTAERAEDYLASFDVANQVQLSPEFEFYVFEGIDYNYGQYKASFNIDSNELQPSTDNAPGHYLREACGYHASGPADKHFTIRNAITTELERNGVDVKYHHHEVGGAGACEIEIGFNHLKRAADLNMFIKHTVKNLADRYGKTATFMPKPLPEYPGSGLHLHLFLTDDNENVFSGSGYGGLNETARQFIAGVLDHGRSLSALTNPSTNSYKRLAAGHETPVNLLFSQGNRTAAIRIPGYIQTGTNRRIELRTPDATCNPYLAFSAILMAGLDGIDRKLDPTSLGYGPYDKNVYELPANQQQKLTSIPNTLRGALQALEEDHGYLLKDEVFTEQQIQGWIDLKSEDVKQISSKPHPYEFQKYYDM